MRVNELRRKIILSRFETQEKFSLATGIDEGLLSKYCRGVRKVSKHHQEIIDKALGGKFKSKEAGSEKSN